MINSISKHAYYYLNICYRSSRDVIKAAAIVAAVAAASIAYFSDKAKYRYLFIVVAYPVIDELLARGLLQGSIHSIQHLWNTRVRAGKQTKDEENSQKRFRVRLAAFMHAATQLLVYDNKVRQIVRFALTFFSGLSCGYLKENTKSLIPPICMRVMRNICIVLCPSGNISSLLAILAFDVGSYLYAINRAPI